MSFPLHAVDVKKCREFKTIYNNPSSHFFRPTFIIHSQLLYYKYIKKKKRNEVLNLYFSFSFLIKKDKDRYNVN